jgi:hypothetical protein
MFGLFLCLSWRVCGWLGIDRSILPTLGLPWKPASGSAEKTSYQMREKLLSIGDDFWIENNRGEKDV